MMRSKVRLWSYFLVDSWVLKTALPMCYSCLLYLP
jgi:hypothetical protein